MIWHSFSTRLKQGVWIQRKDFPMWFKLLVWALRLESDRHALYQLFRRVVKIYLSQGKERRNMRFVYTYLKEAYTVTLGVITSNPYVPKIGVKVGKSGLPLLLPLNCRIWILQGSRPHTTAILTILGIHRIVPWWPVVDLSTVLSEFNGVTRVLDNPLIRIAKARLCVLAGLKRTYKLTFRVARALELRSASPNVPVSIEGCVQDSFAFLSNPLYFAKWVRWCLAIGSYWPIVSITLVLLIGWPIHVYNLIRADRRYLGRVTAVYNVAGKTRIIGITNYWIQIALFPLHRAVFSFLEKLPTDGTFDQLKPLSYLTVGTEYRSYDLSAATDRLPIEVQVQALSAFTSPRLARLWEGVIRFPLSSPDGVINYAVGQPMGAYSSWAMLALTHHMIVQAASSSVNRDYAVLGDDVVVSELCGSRYMELMTSLGVSISIAKSIISKDYIEFAKRIRHVSGIDHSLIGPGLVLAAVRNRLLAIHLFAEVLLRDLGSKWDAPRRLQMVLSEELFAFGLIALFGANGVVDKIHAIAPSSGKAWYYLTTYTSSPASVLRIAQNALQHLREKWTKSLEQAKADLERTPTHLWKLSSHLPLILGILHYLCLIVSPFMAAWLYRPVLERQRPVYPHTTYLVDYIPLLFEQLSDLEVGTPESLDRKRMTDMLATFRKIYPKWGSQENQGVDPSLIAYLRSLDGDTKNW